MTKKSVTASTISKAMPMPGCIAYAGKGSLRACAAAHASSVDPRGLLPAADQGQSTADTKELDHILAMHFGWWDVFVGKKKPMSATSPMTTANDSTSTATSLDLTGSFLNGSDSTQ